MLYKKFGTDIYQKTNPEYKAYQTDNGKESLAITKNYTVLKQVGDGATSVVVKACRNKDINDSVAIKKVKRVFEHTAFAHRAMRELRLLRCLGSHDNVSLEVFLIYYRSLESMISSCLVISKASVNFTSSRIIWTLICMT